MVMEQCKFNAQLGKGWYWSKLRFSGVSFNRKAGKRLMESQNESNSYYVLQIKSW